MADEEKKAKKGKKKKGEPEKPKRSLKGTSRLFMGFRDRTPKISKKGQFRSASAFFWGLHTGPQKTKRKRKARAVLQSTSKLMTQMRVGKKKRAMRGKKPSFMVIRFPGRRGYGRLRPRAQSLSKASTAINWLTKRFLLKKAEESGSERAAVDAWLSRSDSRVGSRKLPFPSGAEILRPGGRLRRFPRSRSIYASGDPVGFLPFEDEAPFRHAGSRRSLYGLEGFQDLGEYYDYHREGDDYYDQRSLPLGEEQAPYGAYSAPYSAYPPYGTPYSAYDPYDPYGAYSPYSAYGPYSPAWPPLADHAPGYPPEGPYDPYPLDYGGPYYPAPAYGYGYGYGYEDHEPPYAPPGGYASPYSYYDGEPYPPGYYLDPLAPYDGSYLPYDLPYAAPSWDPYTAPYEAPYGLPYAAGVYGGDQAIYPPEVPYLYPEEPAFAYPWVPPPIASPHNPYAHPMDDIVELEETEEAAGERPSTSFRLPSAAFFEQQGMDKPARSKLSLIRRFRLFPRPQVKLFGKEKLDVPLPPSLDIPLPLGDEEEEDEEEAPPVRPGPYAHPFWGFLTPRERSLQRALSAFGAHRTRRGLGFGPELGPPRPATSLARFLKKTLAEKQPAARLGGSPQARRSGVAREAAYKRFGYKLAGMDPERPNTPIVLRRAQARARPASPRPRARAAPGSALLAPPAPRAPSPAPAPAPAPPAPFSPPPSRRPPPASPYGSLRRHPPPWAAPAHVPLPPQAAWWAFLEPPPLSPEAPLDLLAFPAPRPSFRGSGRRGATFGFPGTSPPASRRQAWPPLPSPQPSLRSLPGLGYRSPLGPASPQPSLRAGAFPPPFSPLPRRPRSLREPLSPRRASGRLGPPQPPFPSPLLGPRRRGSLNLPSRFPHTWRRLSEPPIRALQPRVRPPFRRSLGPRAWSAAVAAAAAAAELQESQQESEDSEVPWTVPPLAPSWDVDMPASQRPSSPWPGRAGSRRGFSRPPPIPENPFLQHLGPVPSPDSQLEDPDPALTGVFLGRHHDPGPGALTKSASPSPDKPTAEASSGSPRPPAGPEPPSPAPPKSSSSKKKVLRLSLSYPLAACDRMRATWPPWRRWGTLPGAPAPLEAPGAPGPLPRAGERHQAGPGRLAVVLPQVQKPSSAQRAGAATLQPSTPLTNGPEPSLQSRAWTVLWASLWLPAKTHRPWPRAPACSPSCRLGPEAAFLPHGGPWEEVDPKSWWNKVWGHRSEGALGILFWGTGQETESGSL